MKKMIIYITGLILIATGNISAEPILSDVLNNIYGVGNWEPYSAPDELWKYLLYGEYKAEAEAQAVFSAVYQDFGFFPGEVGGSFQSLFSVTTSGYLGGSPSTTLSEMQTGNIFRFADYPTGFPLWSSRVSDNSDGMDHMQTYSITAGPSAGNYVIAWEDMPKESSDVDYQDLIVEVTGVYPVPEPATILLLGLGVLTLIKRR